MARSSKFTGTIGEFVSFNGGPQQAAERLGVHLVTLYRWAKAEREGKPIPPLALSCIKSILDDPRVQPDKEKATHDVLASA